MVDLMVCVTLPVCDSFRPGVFADPLLAFLITLTSGLRLRETVRARKAREGPRHASQHTE